MSLPDPISSGLESAKLIAAGVVLIALIGWGGYETYTKSLVETDLANTKTELTQYKDANENWEKTAAEFNAKIKALAEESDARAKMATKAVADAKAAATAFDMKAKALMALTPSGDDCAATKAFLSSYYGANP